MVPSAPTAGDEYTYPRVLAIFEAQRREPSACASTLPAIAPHSSTVNHVGQPNDRRTGRRTQFPGGSALAIT